MGLSHYPSAAEGVLPVLVMHTVITVAILKSMVRWVFQVMGCAENQSNHEEDDSNEEYSSSDRFRRRISITLFKHLSSNGSTGSGSGSNGGKSQRCPAECCVCLHKFKGEEEVSELSCKHFFHKACLEKWLDHKHSTCPLCRSAF